MISPEHDAHNGAGRGTRFAGLERLWNEGSRRAIARLGVAPGWHCLEVGAGSGSMATWLAELVGPNGSVVATDIDVSELKLREAPPLRVSAFNVRTEPPPPGPYNLIYARLVFGYLGSAGLSALLPELRPGGFILLEDYDWATASCEPRSVNFEVAVASYRRLLGGHGINPRFGASLPATLRALGLRRVRVDKRVRRSTEDQEVRAFFTRTLTAPAAKLVADGLVDASVLERALAEVPREDMTLTTPAMVACSAVR